MTSTNQINEYCERAQTSQSAVSSAQGPSRHFTMIQNSAELLHQLTKENTSTGNVEEGTVDNLAESCNSPGSQCSLPNERKLSSSELNTCDIECEATTPPVPALEDGSFSSNENTCSLNPTGADKADVKSNNHGKPIREVNVEEFGNPYEWPGIPSIYFPSFNSHLPPATDRLHLDVGRNWHNHICQPFVPTLQQTRNIPVESGCNQILSQSIPMSFDWPLVFRGDMTPSPNCDYDSSYISRRQCKFSKGLAVQSMHADTTTPDNAKKLHPGISSSIITELTDCNAALSQQRKK
ncbi:hypothetical protein KIW84_075290 [Lathyrus oleraceus]|uniref:Uncharacterized protein n=1 Tax=Pisum sativum TaxID=3888 RepID=A0A9D4VUX7_PEA|nr:hypothetical protein KIW84_075290 [Pisum sativum]